MTPIPPDPATQAATAMLIVATCAGNAPDEWFLEIRHSYGGPGMRQRFFPVREYRAAARYATRRVRDGNVYVGAAPRVRKSGKASDVDCSWLVWADVDREDAVTRINGFSVAPTFVLLTGTAGHALAGWQLADNPLPADQVESVNRRLALALGGDQAMTSANEVIRLPGTLNHKHDPPEPVRCVGLDGTSYGIEQVVGHLPELPRPAPPPRAPKIEPLPDDDVFAGFAASDYIPALTGREVERDGKVRCPFHAGGEERTPSLHAYDDTAAGWFCFGCERGGTIIDFGAELYGIEPRGAGYFEIRRRLAADLLKVATTS